MLLHAAVTMLAEDSADHIAIGRLGDLEAVTGIQQPSLEPSIRGPS
jgi:hypothetical protein